jgi:hypothetical protein
MAHRCSLLEHRRLLVAAERKLSLGGAEEPGVPAEHSASHRQHLDASIGAEVYAGLFEIAAPIKYIVAAVRVWHLKIRGHRKRHAWVSAGRERVHERQECCPGHTCRCAASTTSWARVPPCGALVLRAGPQCSPQGPTPASRQECS